MQNVFLGSQKCGIFLKGECGRVSTAILILPMPCRSFCFSFNSQLLILLCPWYSWCGTHLWDLSAAAILLLFCVLCSGAYVNVYRTDRKHVSNAAGPEKRLQRGWTISRTPRKSSRTGGKKTVKENTVDTQFWRQWKCYDDDIPFSFRFASVSFSFTWWITFYIKFPLSHTLSIIFRFQCKRHSTKVEVHSKSYFFFLISFGHDKDLADPRFKSRFSQKGKIYICMVPKGRKGQRREGVGWVGRVE